MKIGMMIGIVKKPIKYIKKYNSLSWLITSQFFYFTGLKYLEIINQIFILKSDLDFWYKALW